MPRIQIELPDDLLLRAERLAAVKGVSLAELIQHALELLLARTPALEGIEPWEPPTVKGLGWKGWTHEEIRDAGQEPLLDRNPSGREDRSSADLAADVKAARLEHARGQTRRTTPDELMDEILS